MWCSYHCTFLIRFYWSEFVSSFYDVPYLFSIVYTFQDFFPFAGLALASLMKSVMLLSPNWSLISGNFVSSVAYLLFGFFVSMSLQRSSANLLLLGSKFPSRSLVLWYFDSGKMSSPENHPNFMKSQITQRRGQMFG